MTRHKSPFEHRGWMFWPRSLYYTDQTCMQRGRDVARWQTFLQVCGFARLHIDGFFGAHTAQCSRIYMKRHGRDYDHAGVTRCFRFKLYILFFFFRILRRSRIEHQPARLEQKLIGTSSSEKQGEI